MSKYIVPFLALAGATNSLGLGDVKHVIMLMMENRSFQHVSIYLLLALMRVQILTVAVLRYYVRCPWIRRPKCANQLGRQVCLVPVSGT